jgi:acyl-coenzyme A synthetase/AMP-(fatty) acid ligase
MIHTLKIWPEYYKEVESGLKTFEFRNNDRNFKTGDLVELDNDGFMRVVSRENNIINVGGLKVFPVEIELVVSQLDFVIEAIVYGEQNGIVGNIVCLKVIVDKNTDLKSAKKKIKAFCFSKLEKYKVPQKVIITSSVESTNRFKRKV